MREFLLELAGWIGALVCVILAQFVWPIALALGLIVALVWLIVRGFKSL
jgi:hypothetical protein